jgi:hypothetical protein
MASDLPLWATRGKMILTLQNIFLGIQVVLSNWGHGSIRRTPGRNPGKVCKGESHRETEPQESNGFCQRVTLLSEKRTVTRSSPEIEGDSLIKVTWWVGVHSYQF